MSEASRGVPGVDKTERSDSLPRTVAHELAASAARKRRRQRHVIVRISGATQIECRRTNSLCALAGIHR